MEEVNTHLLVICLDLNDTKFVVATGVVNLPMPPICSASGITVKIPHYLSQQTLNNMGSNGLQ